MVIKEITSILDFPGLMVMFSESVVNKGQDPVEVTIKRICDILGYEPDVIYKYKKTYAVARGGKDEQVAGHERGSGGEDSEEGV